MEVQQELESLGSLSGVYELGGGKKWYLQLKAGKMYANTNWFG